MFLNPFEPFDSTNMASSSFWILDASLVGPTCGTMSTNKVNNLTPTFSLGPPSQASSDLHPGTAVSQPSLVTTSLGPHGFSLSTSTLNAFNTQNSSHASINTLGAPAVSLGSLNPRSLTVNTFSVPAPTVSTFSAPVQTLNSLSAPAQTLNTLCAPAQTLNTLSDHAQTLNTLSTSPMTMNSLSTSNQTLNTFSTPAQNLNTLNAPSQTLMPLNAAGALNTLGLPNMSGVSSSQAFLPSSHLASIVSLPQTLCFPSQSSHNSVSGSGSTPLSVTFGFPLGTGTSLTSNTLSLGTNSILNSFNTGTISLGSSILQPLSMSQNQAVCTSLPQNISFPILGLPNNAAGATGSHFLTGNLSGFPSLSSVFINGQQSVLVGGSSSSTPQSSQLAAVTGISPQSLTFPIPADPALAELSSSVQPLDQSKKFKLERRHAAEQTAPTGHFTVVASPVPASARSVTETLHKVRDSAGVLEVESSASVLEVVSSASVLEVESSAGVLKIGNTTGVLEVESVADVVEEGDLAKSELTSNQTIAEDDSKPQATDCHQGPLGDGPLLESDPLAPTVSNLPIVQPALAPAACEPSTAPQREVAEHSTQDHIRSSEQGAVESIADCSEEVNDKQPKDADFVDSPDVCEIKQEAVDAEEGIMLRPLPPEADVESLLLSSPPSIKVESGEDQINSSNAGIIEKSACDTQASSPEERSSLSLLTTFKKELKEKGEDDDSETLPLPDTSEDSQDSSGDRPRHFPLATLRLIHADSTVASPAFGLAKSCEGGIMDCRALPTEIHVHDEAEQEFIWEDYLSVTNTMAVPPTAFTHVECSLQSSFEKGMRVEVANKENPGTYWVAAIILNSGPLLRLRWEGFSESEPSAVFWSEFGCDVHPIGWCAEQGKKMEPPEGIKDKEENWDKVLQEILKTVPHAPSYLLDSTTGTSPFEQLKQGMRLEMQNPLRPNEVWLVRITENVGGRLYLRIEGAEAGKDDFWSFYLSHLLHPIGWAASKNYLYKPPKILTDQKLSESETAQILKSALKEAKEQSLPPDIFKDQVEIIRHRFKTGMKLEAVNPTNGSQIGPATVVEIIDEFYFIVEMDDLTKSDPEKRIRFACHCKTPFIFPIQWTVYKGIKLTSPPGWQKPDFSWQEYLAVCNTGAAPEDCFELDLEEHEFERGMKLECVNPEKPNQICVATITKIVAHLMWVHLDSSPHLVASHVEHAGSHNLFPVGWCESNGYPLQPPFRLGLHGDGIGMSRRVAVVQPEQSEGRTEDGGRTYNGNCPIVYFNHKCFSGPLLSKSRLSELPRSIGPGPVHLVVKEVLSLLINVAYKPSKVLRELQQEGAPNPAMTPQILKAKYQGKSYKAVVEVCRSVMQLENFCRAVCIKLECCPYLISPHFISNSCPENCWRLTKTKYTHYYGKKKRKIGRPPGGHTNLEDGPKKPTKRRKRKRLGMVIRKTHQTFGVESSAASVDASDSARVVESVVTFPVHRSEVRPHPHPHSHSTPSATAAASKRLKRKYTHHIPPPSEIRTRGAKLPRYSFERRTHKKILISPTLSGMQGLRSKSAQVLKPLGYMRSSSPQPASRPKSLGNLYSIGSRASSTPSPSTPMSSVSNGTSFSLPPPTSPLPLDRNPLTWSVEDTVNFIKTTDCAHIAKLFREQEIDGQALLLLTLPAVQEHLNLKLGPALKLCHEIERVKCAFYTRYDPARPQARHGLLPTN